jgi:lipopolysaccharide biosynthesis glycosyltransferase
MNFNWEIYKELNPDILPGCKDPQQFILHYKKRGKAEGRLYSIYQKYPNLNLENYKLTNNLENLTKEQLELHWLKHGKMINKNIEPIENNHNIYYDYFNNLLNIDFKKIDTSYNNLDNPSKAIFICVDKNTILGLIMLIQSILLTNNKNKYIFNILANDEDYERIKYIMNIVFPITNYNIQKFNNEDLDSILLYFNNSCKLNKHCKNNMNFARFFYEKYFITELYLYIDTDIIIYNNIDVFFDNLENELIKVVNNVKLIKSAYIKSDKVKYMINKYNLDLYSQSFNAGIYSINNSKFIKEDHLNKLIKFMNTEYDCFDLGTQPIMNIYFYNYITGIPIKIFNDIVHRFISFSDWNFNDVSVVENVTKHLSEIKSIHFTGPNKPWDLTSKYFNLFNNIIKTINILNIKIYQPDHCKDNNSNLLNKFMCEYLKKNKMNYKYINNSDEIHYNDIVIFRFGANFMNYAYKDTNKCSEMISKHIEEIEDKGAICYPSSNLMKYYENKEMLLKLFTDKNIKIPESFFIPDITTYNKYKNAISKLFPVIIKVCYSCSSNNINQAYNVNELDKIIVTNFKNNNGPILIQRKINFTKEARLTYIGDNIYHGYYRIKSNQNIVSGATNYGSSISFDIDLNKMKPFIRKFVNDTQFYMGGIDICWENDNLESDPYVLEVSPIFDINPPPSEQYLIKPYKDFKRTPDYLIEKKNIYEYTVSNILDYVIKINQKPILYCDIDCTISNSEPRIIKYSKNEDYKLYENIINDNPIDGAIDALNKLSEKYKIILITARKTFKNYKNSTFDWLYKWNFKYDFIIYTNNSANKLNYLIKDDILIDDFTINHASKKEIDIENYNKFINKGIKVYKFDNNEITWNSLLKLLL